MLGAFLFLNYQLVEEILTKFHTLRFVLHIAK